MEGEVVNWTKEKPTKEGWYWNKIKTDDDNPMIYRIYKSGNGFSVNDPSIDGPDSYKLSDRRFKGDYWSDSPILEPETN